LLIEHSSRWIGGGMAASGVGLLPATLAARRTACAFWRFTWAPATWAGVEWAAVASRASFALAKHLKQVVSTFFVASHAVLFGAPE